MRGSVFNVPDDVWEALLEEIGQAVSDVAERLSDVDITAADVTDEQRKAYALARVQIWRDLRVEFEAHTKAAVGSAAWFGANGPEIGRAAGLGGGPQANKRWPEIGPITRSRSWLKRHRGELIAAAATFFALADRMHLDPDEMEELRRAEDYLASGELDHDLTMLWYLLTGDLARWLGKAQPDDNDAQARAAIRRLRDLTDDAANAATGKRRRGATDEGDQDA